MYPGDFDEAGSTIGRLGSGGVKDQTRAGGLSDGAAEAWREFFGVMENPYPTDAIRTQLDEARKRIEELEAEVREAQVLKSQLKQVERSSQTRAELRQSNVRWHTKFQEERSAREQAERQARDYRNQASQWQKAYQVVSSKLEASTREATNLRGELQKLEPLKVWAGHPCTVCGKPLTGSVSPELAAKLQKGLGHKRCLEERGSGLGKMLLAVSTA